jgi:hypothetical protein
MISLCWHVTVVTSHCTSIPETCGHATLSTCHYWCQYTNTLSLSWHVVSILTRMFSLYFDSRPVGDSRDRNRGNLKAIHWAHELLVLLQVLRTTFWPASHWAPTAGTCWAPPRAPIPSRVSTDCASSPSSGSCWDIRTTWRVWAPMWTTWMSSMWVAVFCVRQQLTELRCQVVSTTASYAGCQGLLSQPGGTLFWLRFSCVFLAPP